MKETMYYSGLGDYSEFIETTAIYPKTKAIEYVALGLCSEAGEVASVVKKMLRDGTPKEEVRKLLTKELGDCFWYLVRMCKEMDLNPEYVIEANMNKLADRKERGVISGSGNNR